jgi:Glycosyl hydrolases family 16
MEIGPGEIDERFRDGLDEAVWTAAYLPAWSSRAAAAATYEVQKDGLHLTIPPDQRLWCPDLHDVPLRVSAVQSGNWSGPVGSARGQQPFREGLVVTEAQPTQWGFTPHYGRIEVTCRANIGPSSMFSAWMVGLEDQPDRCGEICIVEVFGDSVKRNGDRVDVGLGCGIKKLRDPALTQEFSADPYPLDVSEFHRYAVDWRPGRVDFFVDEVGTKSVQQAPNYPMELIIGVFDFPAEALSAGDDPLLPELVVSQVRGRR